MAMSMAAARVSTPSFSKMWMVCFFTVAGRAADDRGDVGVAFALRHPEQHLGFARGKCRGASSGTGESKRGAKRALLAGAREAGADGVEQVGAGDGLRQVVVGAEVHAGADVGRLAFGGEEDERQRGGGGVGAQRGEDFQAVHAGQHDVAEDEVGPLLRAQAEAVGAGGGGEHAVAFEREDVARDFGAAARDLR